MTYFISHEAVDKEGRSSVEGTPGRSREVTTGTEKRGKQQAWHPTWAHHSLRKGFGSWGTWGPKHEPSPCQYEQGRLRWHRGACWFLCLYFPHALVFWPHVPLHCGPMCPCMLTHLSSQIFQHIHPDGFQGPRLSKSMTVLIFLLWFFLVFVIFLIEC